MSKILHFNSKAPVDIDKAVTMNQFPITKDKQTIDYNVIATALYRLLVWQTRLKVWSKGKDVTPEKLEEEFRNRMDYQIEKIQRSLKKLHGDPFLELY
ncbi:hypothetical protein BgiMline_018798 [Biomphalaria glabrata]